MEKQVFNDPIYKDNICTTCDNSIKSKTEEDIGYYINYYCRILNTSIAAKVVECEEHRKKMSQEEFNKITDAIRKK